MSNLRQTRRTAALFLTLLFVFVSLTGTGAQQRRARHRSNSARIAASPSATAQARPRLVLLVVVDQFRYDYLERFGDLFVENGIRRLMRQGAQWTEANYDHYPTYTAPGHATMMTGAWPAETGIVGNEWPDRETGQRVTSVSDETERLLGGGEGEAGASPRRLMASTIGDELRLTTNDRSKVIGISVKDRSAILPAGRHASAAYWFNTQSGKMVSSTYYFKELPGWVQKYNEARPADKYFGARWQRLLPESEYLKRMGADTPPWENIGRVAGDTNSFPHIITGGASGPGRDFYNALDYSPFSNDLLLSFATQAITNEGLGDDEDTDILSVSFSANDYVGHRYGTYSQELMDITVRVDRQIAALLDFVDRRVGLKNTIVIFTADHGAGLLPEHADALRLGLNGGRVFVADVLRAIRQAISARYNPKNRTPDPTADYIYQYRLGERLLDAFYKGQLYFNPVALKRDGVEQAEIERIAGEAAMTVKGISRYFTRTQLELGSISPADPVARRVLHGFYPRHSGDVIILTDPFVQLSDVTVTDLHGSPYAYDTHVPLIIMGSGLLPGRYRQRAAPSDIAPTLAAILRLQAPSNSVGRVLSEAFPGGEQK
jgi:predicted AlkP superfamily pyrophosphatase or phosphodiesterase